MDTDGQYLVVWRDEDYVIQSSVYLGDYDPTNMTNSDWVALAALTEAYNLSEITALISRGYDLYLVCQMPEEFYDQ